MRGLPTDSGFPEELHVDLDEFRNLVMKYSRAKPDRIELAVEYVGGRIKVYPLLRLLLRYGAAGGPKAAMWCATGSPRRP